MLNIPSAVKARLKRDDIKKNFRVQFPNGEYNDITNENIVWESVAFSESICSQDAFRFGLAESSRIEFETVGIGNMLGMTIRCFCEVDLTGEDVSSMVDWSGDGETVALADSDLGYAFFRIPYGEFMVKSCPRSHEAMTHRKVTAISTLFHNNKSMCPFEQAKTSASWMYVKKYKPRVKEFVAENLAYYDTSILQTLGYTTTTDLFWFSVLPAPEDSFQSPTFKFYDSNNQLVQTVTVSGKLRQRELSEDGTVGGFYDYLLGLNLTGYDTFDARSEVKDYLDENIDYSKTTVQEGSTSYGVNLVDIDDAIKTLFGIYLYPYVTFSDYIPDSEDKYRQTVRNSYFFYEGDKQAACIYPEMSGIADTTINRICISFPYNITFRFESAGGSIVFYSCFNQMALDDVKGYKYNDNSPAFKYFSNRVLSFNATLGPSISEESTQPRSFINAFSFAKILEGFCEMCGVFLKSSRNGGVKLVSLNTETVDTPDITPSDYSEFWWDEYDVKPVTQIVYSYTVDGEYGEETQTDTTLISSAEGSVYDLTDNYVLQNLDGTTRSNIIIAIRRSDLFSILKNILFVPIELTGRGYPHLESGDHVRVQVSSGSDPSYIQDAFNIQTVDGNDYLVPAHEGVQLQGDYIEIQDASPSGQYVYSYALQCELSGIQNLQEFIKSSQGEIISEGGEEDE